MSHAASEPLQLHYRGEIAELVINRPDKRNAFTEAMWAALPVMLEPAAEKCRVLVVRGEGEHFAAGADIGEFETIYATKERGEAFSDIFIAAMDALANFPHPTIAMVRGSAVGGGCGLTLACDLRFADTTTRMGITPAKLGLLYPFNDTKRLVDTVGAPTAKDLMFSARIVDGEEALRVGLVDRLCEPGELAGLVQAYCNRLLDMSPNSATYIKQMIRHVMDGQDRDTEETRALFASAFSSEDFQEGYRAFLEKRTPDFSRPRAGKTRTRKTES